MPLYFAFPASVKLGMVQVVEVVPELLEDELLDDELLEELDEELLELDDEVLELDDELLEELEEELELDELELGGGSPPQATSADERTSGVTQRPQGVSFVFMFVPKYI
jgi:hypothetical protein